jgi:hypothetical protein
MSILKFRSALVCLGLICAALVSAAEVEELPKLKASNILPPELLRNDDHTVSENVEMNRFMCKYNVQTPFGVYKITSTELLKIRVHEFQVLQHATNINGTKEFFASMQKSVVQVPVAMMDTVFHPIDSVKKIGAGVESKFDAAGRFFNFGRKKSQYEDSLLKEAATGKCKRAVAVKLGVDVYSTNPRVQELLDFIARSQAAGELPAQLGSMAAPGAVGMALTMMDLRRDVNKDLALMSAGELHDVNNKILKDLGIKAEIREAFLANKFYSPRHKTVIVANLEAMKNVEGLDHFLLTTLHDKSEEEALFAERQSDMLLYYHKKTEKLRQIGDVGGRLPAAMAKNGDLVVAIPMDYVYVDEGALETTKTLKQNCDELRAKRIILMLTGVASERAKQTAQASGITIQEKFFGN